MEFRKLIPSRPLLPTGIVLAGVRIALGLIWLTSLSWKLPPTFDCEEGEGEGLCFWMEEMVVYSHFDWHRDFVEDVALPNYEIIGYLVVGSELLAGLLLVFGLFTRFGALLGFLMSTNLYIGLSASPFEWEWIYLMMMGLHLLVLATAAGRYFGLDALFHERWEADSERTRTPLARIGALAT